MSVSPAALAMRAHRRAANPGAALARALSLAAVLLQAPLAFALDIGPLVLHRDNQPGLLGHFRISDQAPVDASQLTIRLAHADAYTALGLRYERALSSTALKVEPTMDSGLTVSLRPLPPVTADSGPLNVMVVIFEGTKLTTRLFRVDLRSGLQEFAGVDPTTTVAAGLAPSLAMKGPPQPVPAGQPPAPGPLASAPNDGASANVTRAVEAWAAAWSRRDVDAYVASYLPEYRGTHPSRDAWLAQRRTRILGRRVIEVGVSQLKISVDGAHAEARFVQSYRGDALRQTDRKRLLLTLQSGVWLISEDAIL